MSNITQKLGLLVAIAGLVGVFFVFSPPKALAQSLSASPNMIQVGNPATITFNNPSPTDTDWIGLFTPGSSVIEYIDWVYTSSCNQNPTATPKSSGSCTINIPSAAAYNFRLFANDGFTLLATSNQVTGTTLPPLSITTTSLPSATVGISYSGPLSATGASLPYGWSGSGLPAGLIVSNQQTDTNSSVGGVPTTAGTYTFTVTVTSGNQTSSKQFTLTVNSPSAPGTLNLSMPSSFNPGSTLFAGSSANKVLQMHLSASGGDVTVTQVNFGFPGPSCNAVNNLFVEDAGILFTLAQVPSLDSNCLAKFILSPPFMISSGTIRTLSVYTAIPSSVINGTQLQFSLSQISSTSTTVNGASSIVSKLFTISSSNTNPLNIYSASTLPSATVGINYFTYIYASGATLPYGWTGTNLPPGLIVSNQQTADFTNVAGTPTTAGTYTFDITVTSGSQTATKQFTLTVNPGSSSSPDFTIGNMEISPKLTSASNAIEINKDAVAKFTVKNLGASSVKPTFGISYIGGLSPATPADPNISANTCNSITTLATNQTCDYAIKVIFNQLSTSMVYGSIKLDLDYLNAISESDESNNWGVVNFDVRPANSVPGLATVTPNSGPIGTSVSLYGNDLNLIGQQNIVKFGVTPAQFSFGSGPNISGVIVPNLTPGVYPVTVQVGPYLTNPINFTVTAGSSTPNVYLATDPSTPAAQNIAKGTSNILIHKFWIQNVSSSQLSVSTMDIGLDGTANPSDFGNVYWYDGNTLLGQASIASTTAGAATARHAYIPLGNPLIIPGNSTKVISVSADISANAVSGGTFRFAARVFGNNLIFAPQSDPNLYATYSNIMTIIGSSNYGIATSLDSTSPAAVNIYNGQSNIDFAHFRFTTISTNVTLSGIKLRMDSTTTPNLGNVKIYDGNTLIGLANSLGTPSQWFYLNNNTGIVIPSYSNKYLKVVADAPTNSYNGPVRIVLDDVMVVQTNATVSGLPVSGYNMTVAGSINQPILNLTSPNGGEVFQRTGAGQTTVNNITWTGGPFSNITLWLATPTSTNGNSSNVGVIWAGTPNSTNTISWDGQTICQTWVSNGAGSNCSLAPAGSYKIYMVAYFQGSTNPVTDISDAPFTTSSGSVSLSLGPTSTTVAVNQTFTVNINLNTAGLQTDGIDLYFLRFNPSILQVIDSNVSVAGVQITPGSLLPNTIVNTVDNTAGTIQFSQVASGGSSFTGSGVLATVTFRGTSSGTSPVTFDFSPGSTADTNVAYQSTDRLSSVTNASFTVNPSTTPSTLAITSPNNSGMASVWALNSTHVVSWTDSAPSTSNIYDVYILGRTRKLIGQIASNMTGQTQFNWQVGGFVSSLSQPFVPGTYYLRVVKQGSNATVESSIPFFIINNQPYPGFSFGTNKGTYTSQEQVLITTTPSSTLSQPYYVDLHVYNSANPNMLEIIAESIKIQTSNTHTLDLNGHTYPVNLTQPGQYVLVVAAAAEPYVLGQNATSTSYQVAAAIPPAVNLRPLGWLDSISPDGTISGWAIDPNHLGTPIEVHIYFDAPASQNGAWTGIMVATTDTYRADVNQVMKATGNHGFSVIVPTLLRDGQQHTVYVYAIDPDDSTGASNKALYGSGKSFTLAPDSGNIGQRHPWGSVVLDPDGTVFFLGTVLRYPFPSPEVFFSWGHDFSELVLANASDLAMPIGPTVEMRP